MRTQIRISKISVEMPKVGGDIWVHLTIQKVQWDDEHTEVINTYPMSKYISVTAMEIATRTDNLTDPVTQQPLFISGYGVHKALEVMCMKLVQEYLGGTFDEAGILWQS